MTTELSIEDAIREAIIDKFFEPVTLIVSQPVSSPNGTVSMQAVPTQVEAPSMKVARAIWDANSKAITDAVMARLDIDTIVEQCSAHAAKAVVDRLMTDPGRWSSNPSPSERQKMLAKVYDKVADEFGRQCVEHLRQTGGLMGILEAGASAGTDQGQDVDSA